MAQSMATDIIYCAAGNRVMADIAISAGMLYGAQLPGTVYHPIYFADQNWRSPRLGPYMAALDRHRPRLATVLDWTTPDRLATVLDWADRAAEFAEVVIVIPKVPGGVHLLPRLIRGKEVRLGYSVPTKYGGTTVPLDEFSGWPVHLLGGSPQRQLEIARAIPVASADGNYVAKMAWLNKYWDGREFRDLSPAEMESVANRAHESFRRSCINVVAAWQQLDKEINMIKYHAVKPRPQGKAHLINNWPHGRGTTLCGREYNQEQVSEFQTEATPDLVCGVCLNVLEANVRWGMGARAVAL